MEDAVGTLALYHAWEAGLWGAALVTHPLAALARHIETSPDLAHLGTFVDCALNQWCHPRALHDTISPALDHAARRLRRIEEERPFAMI